MILSEKSATFRDHALEIGLIGGGDRGVGFGIILVQILGADIFRPLAERTSISDNRRPWSCENPFIFDGELKLYELALVVGIKVDRIYTRGVPLVYFCVLFHGASGSFVIEQAIALNDMHSLAVWRAIHIGHGKRPDLDTYGVDHERAALVVTYGIAVPRGRDVRRMRLVQADL